MSRHVASSSRVLLCQLVLSVLLSSTHGLRFIAAPLLAISPVRALADAPISHTYTHIPLLHAYAHGIL